MGFFRQFPKVQYDFFNRGVNYNVTDMFRYVNVDYSFLDDVATYSYYRIQNGERPDIVSQRLYGTPDYYWTFFIVNDHLKDGLAGWPLPQELFEDYMNTEYSGVAVNSKVNLGVNSAGEVLYTNALADEFPVGTEVTIAIPGPLVEVVENNQIVLRPSTIVRGSAKVYARNPQTCQVILRDIVELVPNPFVAETGYIQSANDKLVIRSFSPYRDAVKYYVELPSGASVTGASIARVVTSGGTLPAVVNRATLVGSTSGATGRIYSKQSSLGIYTLYDIQGTFISGEPITGSGAVNCTLSSIAIGASDAVTSTGEVMLSSSETVSGTESYNPFFFDPVELDFQPNLSLKPVTYYEYESELNDKRADIRVIRPNLIYRFANQFSKLINAS
jgi:hypothetical protein